MRLAAASYLATVIGKKFTQAVPVSWTKRRKRRSYHRDAALLVNALALLLGISSRGTGLFMTARFVCTDSA
jgi:hypothetical protein